ncbi:hypothetical protein [Saccharibacillus qingshengii]|uniref:hypothetical protein n=1 Tax=Saccharibacillus qingshengii TaxID=1763540 RepID=UPI001554805A|nr:hypothetical protein [Saccharibacillus qingshengii]
MREEQGWPALDEQPGLLEDHRLERWLASARNPDLSRAAQGKRPHRESPHGAVGSASADGAYSWTQRVQYAVGHAVNRYYAAEPEFRQHADSGELVDYRWPRRISYFDSEKSYWALKDQVIRSLASFFAANGYEGKRPVLLYEQFETYVPELALNLSMIFQVAWQRGNGDGLHLQKFVVEYDPQVLDGYRHAARVFCRHAFGMDPSVIEVYTVLGGERIELTLEDVPYEKSLDYLKLAYSGMEEEQKSGCSCGCGRQESEAITGSPPC